MSRLPPFSEEAESGVLGSVLMDSGKVLALCEANGISYDSFCVPAHRALYRHLNDMRQAGSPVDLLTVGEHLKQSGQLDAVGGYLFLEGLIDSTPTTEHAEYYIRLVYQKYLLRSVIDEASDAIDRCYTETDEDAESIIKRTEKALAGLRSSSAISDGFSLGRPIDGFNTLKKQADEGGAVSVFNINSYLPSFDIAVNKGDLIGILANTGVGKTRMAHNFPFHISDRNFCMVDLELSFETLCERYAAMKNGVSVRTVKERMLQGRELLSPDMSNVFIQKIKRCSVEKIRERVDRIEQEIQEFVDVVGIDYVGLMGGTGSSYERTSSNVEQFKEYISDEGRVGILTSQVTRPADRENGMFECPSPFSAKNSGSIENSCQELIGVWRPGQDRRMMKARCLKYTHDDPPEFDIDLIADDLIVTEARKPNTGEI